MLQILPVAVGKNRQGSVQTGNPIKGPPDGLVRVLKVWFSIGGGFCMPFLFLAAAYDCTGPSPVAVSDPKNIDLLMREHLFHLFRRED